MKTFSAEQINNLLTQMPQKPAMRAVIREDECIGCTKCIQVCPADAILGAAKQMHTIIANECTGCELCVAPCPVDCIEMVPVERPTYNKEVARQRVHAKQTRKLSEEHQKQQAYREKRLLTLESQDHQQDIKAKQEYIQQALARVKARKNS